ncbi:MAG: hypothetical protein F6K40_14650 [Okeania sp. SIO3I5]|uniref:hypothetical protein n=1 Tax=Okeania sp. SIO3I5 TaxID=2607805 RepID=UPI0013BD2F94|nr:hypothetical protein [Okeania sp. SIO3I5]NEQ37437.1 hypothetical protein [Okeania sp. SIO3I5]
MILAAQSGVNVDLPGTENIEKARGFKTLIAFKVISLALMKIVAYLEKGQL